MGVAGAKSLLIAERRDPAILVVSDDDYVGSQIERFLAGSGYPILRASNYPEAAGAFNKLPVAVIVSEAELGAYSWRDVAAFSSELSRPPYLIVVTGLATAQLWQEVLEEGGVNVFAKSPIGSGLRLALETSLMDWIHLP
jgi:response regulator RpfG family c-di-GMP phosphodiesterase